MTGQVFQISVTRISTFPFQIAEIITADNLATYIGLAVQYRNHHRIRWRSFIHDTYNSVTVYHSHLRANAGGRTFVERDIVIGQCQTVFYHMSLEQLIVILRHLPDTVNGNRVHLAFFQRFLQIGDLLFEQHIPVQ